MRQAPSHPALRTSAGHVTVAVFLSRIAGLVRERVFASFLGTSAAADAYQAAFRIPTFIQSLVGEITIGASFVPEYSRALESDSPDAAARLAAAFGTLLTLLVAVVVLAGIAGAPVLVAVIAPGFDDATRELTVRLVRILFPAAGLLVLSAWCVGVLNSHRRFFLPFVVPVLSAASVVAAMVWTGAAAGQAALAEAAAWGGVVGAGLQVLAQLGWVLRLAKGMRPRLAVHRPMWSNFGYAAARGGVIRLGTWIDVAIAGFLVTGAVAALGYADLIYSLPIGLFGVAITSTLLPELSRHVGRIEDRDRVRARIQAGFRHTAVLMVPCAAAFIALGDVLIAAIYQSGEFVRGDVLLVWAILGPYAIGLVATALGGVLRVAFYAFGDARTPLGLAAVRLVLRGGLGVVLALVVPGWVGVDARWGVSGLAAAAGITGWIEFVLLRRALTRHVGRLPTEVGFVGKLWLAAGVAVAVAVAVGWGLRTAFGPVHPVVLAFPVLGSYGGAYFSMTAALGVDEARVLVTTGLDMVRRRR